MTDGRWNAVTVLEQGFRNCNVVGGGCRLLDEGQDERAVLQFQFDGVACLLEDGSCGSFLKLAWVPDAISVHHHAVEM